MQQAEFESLVVRMERFAEREPHAYRRRVFGLAALGYVYLILVVLALAALTVAAAASILYLKAVALKLSLFVGALLWAVIRALWVKLEPPDGERILRGQAPELFALIDDLRRRLQTPPVHEVLLTADFNAGVTQCPRLGLFGWHRNHLILGLPLMKALSVDQLKSVIAHELGHLSGGHGRAGNHIYRLRLIWARLDTGFEQNPRWGAGLILAFFKWFIPYFNATSFPLARANEYAADAAAVKLTSARTAAQALTSVNVMDYYFEETYWPAIHGRAKDVAKPDFLPYTGFRAAAVGEVPQDDLQRWQTIALARQTSHADTHPALSDRLRKIGARLEFAPPAADEGSDLLLGPALNGLQASFDARWREQINESWQQFYAKTQQDRARLEDFRSSATIAPLEEVPALEMADLEESIGEGPDAALALRQAALARFPDSYLVRFAVARQLLRRADESGVSMMQDVVVNYSPFVLEGAESLRDYFSGRGELEKAGRWQRRYEQRLRKVQAARLERSQWLVSDELQAHGLEPGVVARLVRQFNNTPELRRVYLVRKTLEHFPEEPLYLLGFSCSRMFEWRSRGRTAEAMTRLHQIEFPGETLLVSIEGDNRQFVKKLKRVPASQIL
jgi:Zn-dependent protease with chaperone function